MNKYIKISLTIAIVVILILSLFYIKNQNNTPIINNWVVFNSVNSNISLNYSFEHPNGWFIDGPMSNDQTEQILFYDKNIEENTKLIENSDGSVIKNVTVKPTIVIVTHTKENFVPDYIKSGTIIKEYIDENSPQIKGKVYSLNPQNNPYEAKHTLIIPSVNGQTFELYIGQNTENIDSIFERVITTLDFKA